MGRTFGILHRRHFRRLIEQFTAQNCTVYQKRTAYEIVLFSYKSEYFCVEYRKDGNNFFSNLPQFSNFIRSSLECCPPILHFLQKNLAIHRMTTRVARQPNTKKIRSCESSEFWLHSFGVVFPSKICHRPTNQSVALLRLVKFDES